MRGVIFKTPFFVNPPAKVIKSVFSSIPKVVSQAMKYNGKNRVVSLLRVAAWFTALTWIPSAGLFPLNYYNMRHRKIPVIDVEITRMAHERNFIPDFDFIMVDAHVKHTWEDITKANAGPKLWTDMHMEDNCGSSFFLPLLRFGYEPVRICLRQDSLSPEELSKDAGLIMSGKTSSVKELTELFKSMQPVKGYVLGHFNSRVEGYLIDGAFCGSVVVFYERGRYHLHFYVEPVRNTHLYKRGLHITPVEPKTSILFEYIPHTDKHVHVGPVPSTTTAQTSTSEYFTSTKEPPVITPAITTQRTPSVVTPAITTQRTPSVVPAETTTEEPPVIPPDKTTKAPPVIPPETTTKEPPVIPSDKTTKAPPVILPETTTKEPPVIPSDKTTKPPPPPETTTKEPPVISPETTTKEPPGISPETTTKESPVISPETTTKESPVISPETTTKESPLISPETTTKEPPVTTPATTTKEPPIEATTTEKPVVETTTKEPEILTTTLPPDIITTSLAPVTTTAVPKTTSAPPVTTTEAPATTTMSLQTTTEPPVTSTLPAATTSVPPETTSAQPETTTEPPGTTTEPAGTTTQPPGTTTEAPGTTTESAETTTEEPKTTTEEPKTTTEEPKTTTEEPKTTTEEPKTTTEEPKTTTEEPKTTTEKPKTTTEEPKTTTEEPKTTTEEPKTTTEEPKTTTEEPRTTTEAPATTTEAPATTTLQPATTSLPPLTTSLPPETTSLPPLTTSLPPLTTSLPPETTSLPPLTTSLPPDTTSLPPETTSLPPLTTSLPPETTSLPPDTTSLPPDTTSQPPLTTSIPPDTTSVPPDTTSLPPLTTSIPPDTTSQPPDTTSQPPDTTSQPPDTTSQPPDTTSQPPDTTSQPPDTTSQPPDTTSQPPDTTSQPPDTTSLLPDTTSLLPDTTSLLPDTTSLPPDTTSVPPDTTSLSPDTTSMPPLTTSIPVDTTSLLPATTTDIPLSVQPNPKARPPVPDRTTLAPVSPATTTLQPIIFLTTTLQPIFPTTTSQPIFPTTTRQPIFLTTTLQPMFPNQPPWIPTFTEDPTRGSRYSTPGYRQKQGFPTNPPAIPPPNTVTTIRNPPPAWSTKVVRHGFGFGGRSGDDDDDDGLQPPGPPNPYPGQPGGPPAAKFPSGPIGPPPGTRPGTWGNPGGSHSGVPPFGSPTNTGNFPPGPQIYPGPPRPTYYPQPPYGPITAPNDPKSNKEALRSSTKGYRSNYQDVGQGTSKKPPWPYAPYQGQKYPPGPTPPYQQQYRTPAAPNYYTPSPPGYQKTPTTWKYYPPPISPGPGAPINPWHQTPVPLPYNPQYQLPPATPQYYKWPQSGVPGSGTQRPPYPPYGVTYPQGNLQNGPSPPYQYSTKGYDKNYGGGQYPNSNFIGGKSPLAASTRRPKDDDDKNPNRPVYPPRRKGRHAESPEFYPKMKLHKTMKRSIVHFPTGKDMSQTKDRGGEEVRDFGLMGDARQEMIFDIRSAKLRQCNVDIMIDPNFALNFGYLTDRKYAVGEMIRQIRRLNWAARASHFHGGKMRDNIGFRISKIVVLEEAVYGATFKDPTGHHYPRSIKVKALMPMVKKKFKEKFQKSASCLQLAFVYLNLAPYFAVSNTRSICGEDRIGIISGYLHSHQIGTYDIFRGIMHVVGLSFGARRDDLSRRGCSSEEYTYINPFPNHPTQMLNVGMRTHSRMLSPCAQESVAQYLTGPHLCLVAEDGMKPFCGNGIVEANEECDCGPHHVCQKDMEDNQTPCCGEGDTLMGCKRLGEPGRTDCPVHDA